ncbi:MAG: UDP-3-O-(3-hydroxymyristoyl)glucosamine N-acyltransferase [Gammaproteobacteria bacterium]
MGVSLADLAAITGSELRGDPDLAITGVGTLAGAGVGQITFLSNSKYRKYLEATKASAVIVGAADADACPVAALVAADPYVAYAKVAQRLAPAARAPGVHPSAVVDPSATLGSGVTVGPGCVVGAGAVIGDDSWLVANVTVLERVQIGKRVIVHPGAVIGADGFGIAQDAGRWIKVPQLGTVLVGDDCEIGANTTIDRGALEDTVLEEGVKLDNLIMVAHNVHIGAHTVVAGCVGIAGSTRIGKRCLIAGASGISGHLNIADDVMIMAMSMVTSDIHQAGQYASGLPLDSLANWRRNGARFRHLDELAKRVKALEKKSDKD